jgi:hypothetical protein
MLKEIMLVIIVFYIFKVFKEKPPELKEKPLKETKHIALEDILEEKDNITEHIALEDIEDILEDIVLEEHLDLEEYMEIRDIEVEDMDNLVEETEEYNNFFTSEEPWYLHPSVSKYSLTDKNSISTEIKTVEKGTIS